MEATNINSIDDVTAALTGAKYRSGTTDERLAEDVAAVLTRCGVTFERNRRMSGGMLRADFWLPELAIVIDCRTRGKPSDVQQELSRFCQQRNIEGLVLVTSRQGLCSEREQIMSKPVRFVWIGGNY